MTMNSSTDAIELAKFTRLGDQWWDPNGAFASLHKFNPVRLKFIRDTAAAYFNRDIQTRRPFEGLSLLDLGCGGGLLAEPMARLGFTVTGCDAADASVRAAASHAEANHLPITYRCATPEMLGGEALAFDVILAMEIVEHVADVGAFIFGASRLLRPGGLILVATLNKTLRSLLLAKIAAEYVLRWLPPGTHDWNRFVRPEYLRALLVKVGLDVIIVQGMAFDPLRWDWSLSRDTDVNYVIVATSPRMSNLSE